MVVAGFTVTMGGRSTPVAVRGKGSSFSTKSSSIIVTSTHRLIAPGEKTSCSLTASKSTPSAVWERQRVVWDNIYWVKIPLDSRDIISLFLTCGSTRRRHNIDSDITGETAICACDTDFHSCRIFQNWVVGLLKTTNNCIRWIWHFSWLKSANLYFQSLTVIICLL